MSAARLPLPLPTRGVRVSRWFVLVLVGAVAVPFVGGRHAATVAPSAWGSVPLTARPAIRAALARDLSPLRFTRFAGGFRGALRFGAGVEFDRSGVTLAEHGRTLGLTVAAFGRGEGRTSARPVTPTGAGSRVTYSRPGLVESYVNRPRGLEQTFSLARRPAGAGMLKVVLRLSGPLAAGAYRDGGGVRFGPLTYGGLKVVDARGAVLPARLELGKRRLTIAVDDAGAVYPLLIDPWVQLAGIGATSGAAADQFGGSVAVSSDASTIVVGAPAANSGAGAVYVFVGYGATWTQVGKLTDSAAGPLDSLGTSVAVDGSVIVAGAPDAHSFTGAADVFVKTGTRWTNQHQAARLIASDAAGNDDFGRSVGISGSTVVAGADGESSGAGAAYVFTKPGGGWSGTVHEQTKLTEAGAAQLGVGIAISGGTIVAGTNKDSGGAAYVFTGSGASWTPQATLTASDDQAGWRFGSAVAIDGGTIAVGAPGADGKGAAYVFTGSDASWSQVAKLIASGAVSGDGLGTSVGLSGDTVAAGAPGALSGKGAVDVYVQPDGGWVDATQTSKLTASNGAAGDALGTGVGAGYGIVAGGAPSHNSATGEAYLFSGAGDPGSPAISSATAGDGSVQVAFSAPASDGGATIDWYTVSAAATGAATKSTTVFAVAPVTLTGLTNGVTYTVTVTAHNMAGHTSPPSTGVPATPIGAPGKPTITKTAIASHQVKVTFSPPATNGGAPINYYTVTATATGAATRTTQGVGSPLTVTQLTNGTTYTFTVTAHNTAHFTSKPSAAATATPAAKPGAPTITGVTAGSHQVTVTFTPPTSNGGVSIDSYLVTATAGTTTAKKTGTASPITVAGLTNGTTYTLKVQAHNAAGYGPASAGASGTPKQPPVVVAAVQVAGVNEVYVYTVSSSGGSVSLTEAEHWSESLPNSASITSLALGNVTSKGAPDVIEGTSNKTVYVVPSTAASFNASDDLFAGPLADGFANGDGVYVAADDLNGNGTDEVIVSSGPGSRGQVDIFAPNGTLSSHFAPVGSGWKPGRNVAVGTFTTAGGVAKHAIALGDATGTVEAYASNGDVIQKMVSFPGGVTGGVSLAIGRVAGSHDHLFVGFGPGSPPSVYERTFDSADRDLSHLYAYDSGSTFGASVAAADLNGDGKADIVTVPGKAVGIPLKVFSGVDFSLLFDGEVGEPDSGERQAHVAAWSPGG